MRTFKKGNIAEEIYYMAPGAKLSEKLAANFKPSLILKTKKGLKAVKKVSKPSELKKILPGWRPHKITKGNSRYIGYFSLSIDNVWRICFEWRDGKAYNIEVNKHYGDGNS